MILKIILNLYHRYDISKHENWKLRKVAIPFKSRNNKLKFSLKNWNSDKITRYELPWNVLSYLTTNDKSGKDASS